MSESKTKARRLRELLRDARPVVSPGVYDGYSARLVEKMVLPGFASGDLAVPVMGAFALDDAAEAYERFQSGAKFGKIVLEA